jgi:hypothetical protein
MQLFENMSNQATNVGMSEKIKQAHFAKFPELKRLEDQLSFYSLRNGYNPTKLAYYLERYKGAIKGENSHTCLVGKATLESDVYGTNWSIPDEVLSAFKSMIADPETRKFVRFLQKQKENKIQQQKENDEKPEGKIKECTFYMSERVHPEAHTFILEIDLLLPSKLKDFLSSSSITKFTKIVLRELRNVFCEHIENWTDNMFKYVSLSYTKWKWNGKDNVKFGIHYHFYELISNQGTSYFIVKYLHEKLKLCVDESPLLKHLVENRFTDFIDPNYYSGTGLRFHRSLKLTMRIILTNKSKHMTQN